VSLTEKRTVIFGKTGRGKTVLSVDLIKSFYLKENRPVIIFDLQGEYVALPHELNAKLSLFEADKEENTKKIQENLVFFSDRKFNNGLEKAIIGGLKFDLSKLGLRIVLALWGRNQELDTAWNAETFVKEVQEAFKVDVRTEENSSLDSYLAKKNSLHSGTQSALRRKFYEVKKYHRDGNDLEKKLEACLANNKIIIFDLATSTPDEQREIIELVLTLVLDKNRNAFIQNKSKLLAPLIVLDEAQLYFSEKMNDRDPVVRLFKEGRKFKLSSLMMTQQPSSISSKVLSQVENVFTFGMTASADMRSLTEIHRAFNSTVAYQIETNRRKHRPFVLTDNIPFAIQIDSHKDLFGDENKIFQVKYMKNFIDAG
jgi:DNA helicase HerA-like ATPase